MKKFICVLVFLALVNVANAGMVDIVISSLNGAPINPVKEITIKPTDVINMDIIYTPTGTGYTLFGLSVDMFAEPGAGGTLDATTPTWPSGVWDMNPPMTGTQSNPDGSVGIWAAAAGMGLVNGIAVDHILFHCDAPGTVILMLRANETLPPGYTIELDPTGTPIGIDSYGTPVIIHQEIPEPITLTLLGLGGLFLARRKK